MRIGVCAAGDRSAHGQAFAHYLRTGQRLTTAEWKSRYERKFNANHDEQGRFTFAPGKKPVAGAKRPATLKPIRGYRQDNKKDAWRKANDDAFTKAANDYNGQHGFHPGDPGYADPQFVKAWAMAESGGDEHAFMTDPLQANNAGDWDDTKAKYGLTRGEDMTPYSSAKAALEWLNDKRTVHDTSGQPVGYRSLKDGLIRYNGNSTLDANGKPHSSNHADQVLSNYFN